MKTPPRHDASQFIAQRLREIDEVIAEAVPRVLEDTDEEALHDLRVAIRRMRVLLKLARPIFSRFYADAVREPFTAFHRATSELRDEEVLEALFAKLASDDAAFTRWRARRARREREIRAKVLERVQGGEVALARRKLAALLELPVKPKRHLELGAFARHAVMSAQGEVEKLREAPLSDPVGLHELRIAYKNLRYAAELLGGALPPDLRALAEPAKRLQTKLGDLHDADVAISVIGSARGLPPTSRNKALRAARALRAALAADYATEMGIAIDRPRANAGPRASKRSRPSAKKQGARRPKNAAPSGGPARGGGASSARRPKKRRARPNAAKKRARPARQRAALPRGTLSRP